MNVPLFFFLYLSLSNLYWIYSKNFKNIACSMVVDVVFVVLLFSTINEVNQFIWLLWIVVIPMKICGAPLLDTHTHHHHCSCCWHYYCFLSFAPFLWHFFSVMPHRHHPKTYLVDSFAFSRFATNHRMECHFSANNIILMWLCVCVCVCGAEKQKPTPTTKLIWKKREKKNAGKLD